MVAADPHQAVQRAAFAVQAGAVSLDLCPAVQHDLWTQGEILHQHPSVVQHLALTLAADRTTCRQNVTQVEEQHQYFAICMETFVWPALIQFL